MERLSSLSLLTAYGEMEGMDVKTFKGSVSAAEALLQEELDGYMQLHALTLERGTAIEKGEYSRLATITPECERLMCKVMNLERRLRLLPQALLTDEWSAGRENTDAFGKLRQKIYEVVSAILAMERNSFSALSSKYSAVRAELLGMADGDNLSSYTLRTHVPARFLDIST